MSKSQGKPTQVKLEKFKSKLLEERDKIVNAARIESGIDGIQNADMLEDAAAVAEHTSHHIHAIDAALRMIEAGNYGICSNCNKQIPFERLEIVPDCTMCVTCSDQNR